MCSTMIFALLASLLLGGTAMAAQIYTEGYFEYQVKEDSVTICGYYGKETEVTVPAMIAGNPVSKIAKGVFGNTATVKKVYLPDTIMTIEEGAFQNGIDIVYNSNTDQPSAGEKETQIQGGTSQGEPQSGTSSSETQIGAPDGTAAGSQSDGQTTDEPEGTEGTDSVQAGIDGAEVELPEEPEKSEETGQEHDGSKLWIAAVIGTAVLAAGAAAVFWGMKRRKKRG